MNIFVNAMYPIQQQKSYLLGCNPFDKYIVFVSLPPVPVVEQNRIWGQSEQSSTGATISSLCKTNHVWLQQQLIKWSKRNQNVENEKLADSDPWPAAEYTYIMRIFNTHMCVLFGWHWHMREHRGPYRSPRLQARSLNKVIFLHFILYYLSLSMSKESWLFLAGQDLQRGPSQPGGQVHLPSTGSQLKLKWFQNWIDTDGSIDHHIQVATKSK